jgi:hypothetical protein
MTIKQLRNLLEGLDENMMVLIPASHEFDGVFYSPCPEDSGVSQIGTDATLDEEDIKEMELLSKPIPSEECFMLIPCGFGDVIPFVHNHLLN